MANYYAYARSNSFCVKDLDAFKQALPKGVALEVEAPESNLVKIYVEDDDGWPAQVYNETVDDWEEWEPTELAEHLVDGEWCVVQEVGNEKLRYLVGYATAFNNKGEVHRVSIDDIFKKLPEEVSTCRY